ncbi:MAG: AMP-binding protein [Syntrophaceae bacterium]|nr:AMP-binding protein [Syntrophaceae bacterium]
MKRWLNIGDMVSANADIAPDKMGARDLNRSMTFKVWNERSCRLANSLLDLGLKKGDSIGFIAYNCVEWLEIYVATAKAGLVTIPIMFRLAPPEIEYILKDSQAKAFIVGESFIEGVDSIRDNINGVKDFIYLGNGLAPEGYVHYEDLMSKGAPDEPDVEILESDGWVVCYTSGTTGKPKGAMRTHECWTPLWLIDVAEIGLNREDIGLIVLPMCHSNSLNFGFALTYTQAAICVYNRTNFDPEELLKTISEEKITFTSLVPTHYIRMLALSDEVKEKYDVSHVRKLMCSSAPARRDVKANIMEMFGNSDLYDGYGASETGTVTLLRPEHTLDKLGSIGREVIGTPRIKLLDDEGNEVPEGQVGELYSKAPFNFAGYLNKPEETKASYRGEYFSAGDMAYRDEDGFYFLVDRKKNMIVSGGENIYPSEVEDVVGAHPDVKDVAIIGIPDAKWGEAVKAVVILHDGVDPREELKQEIMDFCNGKIARYKMPRSVDFVLENDVPRTSTGKILHKDLRERYGKWGDRK